MERMTLEQAEKEARATLFAYVDACIAGKHDDEVMRLKRQHADTHKAYLAAKRRDARKAQGGAK